MAPKPDPKRGMPRSLIYALIPGGFILLVVGMLVFGGTADEPPAMEEAREEAEERSD